MSEKGPPAHGLSPEERSANRKAVIDLGVGTPFKSLVPLYGAGGRLHGVFGSADHWRHLPLSPL